MAVQHILLLIITIHDQTLHNLHTSFPFARKYCVLAECVFAFHDRCDSRHVISSNSAGASFPIEHNQCPTRLLNISTTKQPLSPKSANTLPKLAQHAFPPTPPNTSPPSTLSKCQNQTPTTTPHPHRRPERRLRPIDGTPLRPRSPPSHFTSPLAAHAPRLRRYHGRVHARHLQLPEEQLERRQLRTVLSAHK